MEESEFHIGRVESLQLANEFNELGATFFALYVTLVSGYLVTAYLAGAQLTRAQLRLVNAIFIFAAAYFLYSTMSMWVAGISFYLNAASDQWQLNSYLAAVFNIVLSIAMLVGIFASVRFMRDVRRNAE